MTSSSTDLLDDDDDRPPLPTGAELREQRERLVADAERKADFDLKTALADLLKAGEERQERFKLTICQVSNESFCHSSNEQACEFNRDSSCPKRKAEEDARSAVSRRKWLKQAGVSERVLKAVVDVAPQQTDAIRLMREATQRDGACLVVLQGGVGCGKSCAAAVWAAENNAHWITAKALARGSAYDDASKKLERYRHLVIDDLGTEYADAKGFFLSNLDGLIDARYADDLPTIITTNVAAEEFKQRYGDRIADRIRHTRGWVEIGGTSLRVRK